MAEKSYPVYIFKQETKTIYVHIKSIDPVDLQMNVIHHSVEKLQTALVSDRQDLAKQYRKYTKEERKLLEKGLHPGQPGSLFQPITVHSDSDWITSHPEEPQSFQSFYSNLNRKSPDARHNTVYIQTIGESVCATFTFEK